MNNPVDNLNSDQRPEDNRTIKKHKKFRWLVHLVIFLLVAYSAYYFIDFSVLVSSLLKPDIYTIFMLLGISTIDRFLMSAKWLHLLSLAKINIKFRVVLRAYYEAAFIARVTPIAMGSELLRAYTIVQHTGEWKPVLGSMVAEKVIAIISSTFLACAGSFIIITQLRDNDLGFLPLTLMLATISATIIVLLSMSEKFSASVFKLFIHKKLISVLTKLHNAYAVYSKHLFQLLVNWFIALIENCMQVALLFFSARATGIEIAAPELFAILTISQLLRKFALILEGWMLGEAAVVVTCAILGIDQSQALAFSLLSGAIIIISTTPGLVTLLMPSGKIKREKLKKDTNKKSHADITTPSKG